MKKKGITIILTCLTLLLLTTSGITASGVGKAPTNGVGQAPIAENLELTTYREVEIGEKLTANDSDGQIKEFQITVKPRKGTVELKDDGIFVYTPKKGKGGIDYFAYCAIDNDGNKSNEATVTIKIGKMKKDIKYEDMKGNPAHCYAVTLAEKGIFVGECIGGNYYFNPTSQVSRGEFLSMCMKAIDADILEGVTKTGFADDNEIPEYMKPTISTALLSGIITGYTDGKAQAVFKANAPVSSLEAAVIVDKSLDLTNVSSFENSVAVPVWAAQSFANLKATRISEYKNDSFTRADCAKWLCSAIEILEKR